jgi:hypothetical protein
MIGFSLNWFLGVLAVELWVAPYLLVFWPDIAEAWQRRRQRRALARLAARHGFPPAMVAAVRRRGELAFRA